MIENNTINKSYQTLFNKWVLAQDVLSTDRHLQSSTTESKYLAWNYSNFKKLILYIYIYIYGEIQVFTVTRWWHLVT